MSLTRIRAGLIDCWPRPTLLNWHERAGFEEQLKELKGAHDACLWKSVCVLAGQIIEALLKKRLQILQSPPDLDRVTGLGHLINIAYARNVLPRPVQLRASTASLGSTRMLRNWAAHYTLTSRTTTELRATQSVALSYCATVALFPLAKREFTEMDRRALELLAMLVRTPHGQPLPVEVLAELPALCKFSATLPLDQLLRTLSIIRKRKLPQDGIAQGIVEHFDNVIAASAMTNCIRIKTVASRCLGMGLREHGRVLSALLPIDALVICELSSKKSPAGVAMYVQHAFRADPELFRAKCAQHVVDARAADALWAGLARRNAGIVNVVTILRRLPPRARAPLMCRAPVDVLIRWVHDAPPAIAVTVAQLLKDRDVQLVPQLRPLREQILHELLNLLRRTEWRHLVLIPSVLRQAQIANENIGVVILESILNDISSLPARFDDTAAMRRLLWDIYAFCEVLVERALAAASVVEQRLPPCWEAACLLGMLWSGLRITVPCKAPESEQWLAALVPPGEANVWEIYYLAFVAARCVLGFENHELPRALRERVVVDSRPVSRSRRSEKLLNDAISLIGTA